MARLAALGLAGAAFMGGACAESDTQIEAIRVHDTFYNAELTDFWRIARSGEVVTALCFYERTLSEADVIRIKTDEGEEGFAAVDESYLGQVEFPRDLFDMSPVELKEELPDCTAEQLQSENVDVIAARTIPD